MMGWMSKSASRRNHSSPLSGCQSHEYLLNALLHRLRPASISGATLFPHTLVVEAASLAPGTGNYDLKKAKHPELEAFRKELRETKLRVVEARWGRSLGS